MTERAGDRWRKKHRGRKSLEQEKKMRRMAGGRPHREINRERGESIMHGWVFIDPARWASNFRLTEKLITLPRIGWAACQSRQSSMLGAGLSAPFCLTRAQNEPRAESKQLSRDPYAFHLFSSELTRAVRCLASMLIVSNRVRGIWANNELFLCGEWSSCCYIMCVSCPPRFVWAQLERERCRGAESLTSREDSGGFGAPGERWGGRRCLWRAFYSPGN